MRARSKESQHHESENEINLTPMLDVVFIMLIFFLVTATFVRETGLDVISSNRNLHPPEANPGILITISKHNEIVIDGRIIDPRAVRANVERLHAADPGSSLVIQPHRKSSNNTLVQVMNAAREAGIYDFALAASIDTS